MTVPCLMYWGLSLSAPWLFLCPVHLSTQPGGSRCSGDGLGSALLSARWTPAGLAPVVTLEALSEGWEHTGQVSKAYPVCVSKAGLPKKEKPCS